MILQEKINEYINDGEEFTSFNYIKEWYTKNEAEKIEALKLSVYKNTYRYRPTKYNI